jgi:hypothetical protein
MNTQTLSKEQPKAEYVPELKATETLFTSNFNLFKFHELNRPLHDSKKLRDDLIKCGFWKSYHPLLCNPKYEILDGQNRFVLAQELGFEGLHYKIVHTRNVLEDLDVIRSTNSVGRPWDTADCLYSMKKEGVASAIEVIDIMDKYKLNSSNALAVCTPDRKKSYDKLKNRSSFDLNPKRREIAEYLMEFTDLPFVYEAKFVRSIVKFYMKSSKEHRAKLLLKRMTIKKQADETAYYSIYCNIVNKNIKKGSELHL